MTRILRLLFLLSVLAGFFLLPAGQAQAGIYYVQICGDNSSSSQLLPGAIYNSGTTNGAFVALPIVNSTPCVTTNGFNYFGSTRISVATAPASASLRGWRLTMPATVTLEEAIGSLSSCRNGSTNYPRLQISHSGGTQTFERVNTEGTGSVFTVQGESSCESNYYQQQSGFRWGIDGTSYWDATQGKSADNMAGAGTLFQAYLYCNGSACGTSETLPHIAVRNLRLRLNDGTNPATPAISGNGPWSNTTVTTTINTGAGNPAVPVRKSTGKITNIAASGLTDTGGSGVMGATVLVNDTLAKYELICSPTTYSYSQTANGVTYSGNYASGTLTPCSPASTRSIAISSLSPESTPWVEGLNNVTLTSQDYSGNTSSASSARQLVIDDTGPNVIASKACSGGQQGTGDWYTSAPEFCSAYVNEENISGRAVAGVATTNGFTYSTVTSGNPEGVYNNNAIVNATMLASPSLYWPLQSSPWFVSETSGQQPAVDLSGSFSSTTQDTPFVATNTLNFPASTNVAATPRSSSYGSLTVSAWVRPTSDTGSPSFVSQSGGNDATNAFNLRMIASARVVQFYGSVSGPSTWSCLGTTPLTLSQWSHVVATRNSSTGVVDLWINGVPDTCQSSSTPTGSTVSTASSINIGTRADSPFTGQIAQVALFERRLDDAEVRRIYQGGCIRTGTPACTGGPRSLTYIPAEGSSTVTSLGTDRVGNTSTSTGTVGLDTVNPEATALSPCSGTGHGTDGALVNGWYTSNVSCTLVGVDNTSKPGTLEWSSKINSGSWSDFTSTSTTSYPRVNLATNPRALMLATNWGGVSVSNLRRQVAPAILNGRTNTAIHFQSNTSGAYVYNGGTTQANIQHVCSAYVYRASGGSAEYVMQARKTDGTLIATGSNSVGESQSGSWVRLHVAFTRSDTGGTRCAVAQNGAGTTATVFVSEMLLEESSSLSTPLPFFDGSSPGASWNLTQLTTASTLNDSHLRGAMPASNSTDVEGTILIKGKVTDNAGRSTQTSELEVKVDRKNPTPDITCTGTTGTNGWFTSQPTCTLSGQDTATGSGVTTLRRKIGSADWETVASSP